jgi:hypothetical protein
MIAAALVATVALGSQDGLGQVQADVQPKFQNGIHFGCEASFGTVIQDTAYQQGLPVAVTGSVVLYSWTDRDRVDLVLKLGVGSGSGGWRAPSQAYLVFGYRTNLAEQTNQTAAESAGFRLFGYDPGGPVTVETIVQIGVTGRFDVAYTLNGGSVPMTFPIQLSDQQAKDWDECVDALLSLDSQSPS